MKKIKAFLFMFLLGLGTLLAQTPGAFNYQAVLRDAEGKIISNQDVGIQISILQQSASGELVFQEKHSASTNEFGLIVLEIGNGIPITGTLAEINWGASTHFLKVELDATGGESYTDMGTSQMLSVPYALYARSSGSSFSGKYADLEGTPELPNDISDLSDAGKLLFDGDYNSLTNKPDLSQLSAENTDGWDKDVSDDFDGDYNSLTNKPTTISTAQASAIDANTAKISNVKADWNAATGEAQILNKPDLSVYVETTNTAAWDKNAADDFSGSFNDLTDLPVNLDTDASDDFDGDYNSLINKPTTISTAQATAIDANTAKVSNVKADWNAATGEAQILNKPDLSVYVETVNTAAWDKNAADDFSGSFNDLTDLPANLDTDSSDDFDGEYASLTNIPTPNILKDTDADTKIQVEKNSDEDLIRIDIAGFERITISDKAIEFKNTSSLYIGEGAGSSMTGMEYGFNTIVGQSAGINNGGNADEASYNSFFGFYSGHNNTKGSYNVAIGNQALNSNVTNNMNTAIGSNAMQYAGNGSNRLEVQNTAIGFEALRGSTTPSNNTGMANTAIGARSMQNSTSGNGNTAVGYFSLNKNSTGANNVTVGYQSSKLNTSGSNNVALGYRTLHQNIGGNGNVAIGYQAGYNETGSNKLYIENSNSTTPLIYGEFDNDLLRINGTLDINNAYQLPTADGTTGQVLTTNGSKTVSWTTIDTHSHAGTASYSFVGAKNDNGSQVNVANAKYATVVGGQGNIASGQGSTIGGGSLNKALGSYHSTVGGGVGNEAKRSYSTVSGGLYNYAMGEYSAVIGGQYNMAQSYGETVLGVYSTIYTAASTTAYNATDRLFVIGNGTGMGASDRSDALVMLKNGNTTLNGQLTINNGTGTEYTLPADNGNDGQVLSTNGAGVTSWVNGFDGDYNSLTSKPDLSVYVEDANTSNWDKNASDDFDGNYYNLTNRPSLHNHGGTGSYAFIGGGDSYNKAVGDYATVGGGSYNEVHQAYSTIGGGKLNKIIAEGSEVVECSTIGGGYLNQAKDHATVAGGSGNKALGSRSAIGGGGNNTATGQFSTIVGGYYNSTPGRFATAAGYYTIANSFGETTVGLYNTDVAGTATSFVGTDRLFVIGNGTSTSARSDALVVQKNGNTTINGDLTVNGNITSEKTYTIGLNADLGGYVIYVTPNGKHGLVAATQDQSNSATWYEAQDAVSNPSNYDSAGQNFTDWRLPTKYELNLLHTYRTEINASSGFMIRYWSSTEYDPDYAYNQGFDDGTIDQGAGTKTVTNYVRAIRSF